MKLRPKLALTLAAVVIPIMVVFTVFRIYAERLAVKERFATRISARAEARMRDRCVEDPTAFHREVRRGYQIYAYDEQYRATSEGAPRLHASLVEALEGGEEIASVRLWRDGRFSGATATRTDWASAECAALVVFWPDQLISRPGRVAEKVALESVVAAIVLLITGLFVAGPLVRRIRRLTTAIEASDSSRYRVGVETDAGDEIGELARAFNRAGERVANTVEELEERDRALTEYVANTTHDLAIPLTVLQHRVRRLQKQLAEDDERRDLAAAAMQEAHYIASLIANMGAAARLAGRGEKLTVHDCALSEIVERVVSRHRPLADQEGIELNWATPPEEYEVECDSTLIEQALSNLVQNAIQYNGEGGHVSVVLEQGGAGFELRVLDDGPGLAEELLEKVLQRDFRVDEARTRRPDGQGFGLSIVSRVCELHGWQFALRNREEGGLEAVVRGA